MRVFKSCDLVPKCIYLLGAVFFDFADGLFLKNAFSADEQRFKQLACREIRYGFALPCEVGVKQLIGLRLIDFFVRKGDKVGNGFACFFIVKAVDLFAAGGCYFLNIFAELDFGDYFSAALNAAELINSAQNRT